MKEIHHLTLQDRQAIQSAIEEDKTKAEIGRLLGKDPCGISREIIRHREFKERNTYNRPILCAKRKDCKIRRCSNVNFQIKLESFSHIVTGSNAPFLSY